MTIEDAGGLPVVDSITVPGGLLVPGDVTTATGELTATITTGQPSDGSLEVVEAGIYPVTVEITAGPVVVETSTFVEVVDTSTPAAPLAIAIVAAVGDPEGVGDIAEMAALVDVPLSIALAPAALAVSTAAADGTPPSSLPAAAQPAGGEGTVPAGEQVSSTAVPGSADVDVLADALRSDELAALPIVPLDPSSLVAVDESGAFIRLLRDGEDVLSAAGPLAVISRAVWIADGPVSAPAAEMLRDLGSRMLVFTPEAAAALGADPAAAVFAIDLGDGQTLPAMTVDTLGSALARDPEAGGAEANGRAVRLMVELQLARRGGATLPAVVLGTPGLTVPDADVVSRFVDFAGELADTAVVPLSRLPGIAERALVTGGPTVALPDVAGVDLTARQADIDAVREQADHASSMLADGADNSWDTRLDALLSSALDDSDVPTHLARIESEIDDVLGAIVAPEPFTFTMTGTSNILRLPLRNAGTEQLVVDVVVRSPKLRIADPVQRVLVPGLSSVEVEVPVRARSNGTFTIEVDVLAPDGYPLTAPVVLKGRVSHVTGLSQVVTGGAAIVLASWWYSHLRRRRRSNGTTMLDTDAATEGLSPDTAEVRRGEEPHRHDPP